MDRVHKGEKFKNKLFAKNSKTKVTPLIILLGFILVIIVTIFFMSSNYTYKSSEEMFQIIVGETVYYEAGTKFLVDEVGATYKGAEESVYLDASPIYSEDESKIVLPKDYIYITSGEPVFYRINSFEEIIYNAAVEYKGKKLGGGILYDGSNTYIFLENMTVEINGKEESVGVFSFVTVAGNNMYTLYNTKTNSEEFGTVHIDGVKATNGEYTVDISGDAIDYGSGSNILLFDNPELLDEY